MANKCVMNMAKRHRVDVRGLQAEANREHEDAKHYKGDIDLAKSDANTYLVKSDDWNASIDETLARYDVKEASNSVVLVTSVYTASPEWFKENDEQTARDYFDTCLEYERRTKGHVINAVIHWDETTPHMHVATVPVVEVQDEACVPVVMKDDNGDDMVDDEGAPIYERYTSGKSAGKVKYQRTKVVDDAGNPVTHMGLSAKQVFGNRVAMSRRQTEFYEVCGKQYGMERGEVRVEDTKDAKQRLSEAKYRAQAMKVEAQAQAEEIVARAQNAAKTRSEAILGDAKQNAGLITKQAAKDAKGLLEALQDVKRLRAEYEQAIAQTKATQAENAEDSLEEWARRPRKRRDGTSFTYYGLYEREVLEPKRKQAAEQAARVEREQAVRRRAQSWLDRHEAYTRPRSYDGHGYEKE